MTEEFPRPSHPARLGGSWFHSTELLEGEEVRKEAHVMHKPSRSQQGGILYLTNRRLVYLPDRWAAIVGDERVVWPLESIKAGMHRLEDGGILLRRGNLLVFECMYAEHPTGPSGAGERHLFSTGLPLTDREWVSAIKESRPSEVAEEPAGAGPAPENGTEATEEAAESEDGA